MMPVMDDGQTDYLTLEQTLTVPDPNVKPNHNA
jgi:hypothetical protein